jgi:hypothetical protein
MASTTQHGIECRRGCWVVPLVTGHNWALTGRQPARQPLRRRLVGVGDVSETPGVSTSALSRTTVAWGWTIATVGVEWPPGPGIAAGQPPMADLSAGGRAGGLPASRSPCAPWPTPDQTCGSCRPVRAHTERRRDPDRRAPNGLDDTVSHLPRRRHPPWARRDGDHVSASQCSVPSVRRTDRQWRIGAHPRRVTDRSPAPLRQGEDRTADRRWALAICLLRRIPSCRRLRHNGVCGRRIPSLSEVVGLRSVTVVGDRAEPRELTSEESSRRISTACPDAR